MLSQRTANRRISLIVITALVRVSAIFSFDQCRIDGNGLKEPGRFAEGVWCGTRFANDKFKIHFENDSYGLFLVDRHRRETSRKCTPKGNRAEKFSLADR